MAAVGQWSLRFAEEVPLSVKGSPQSIRELVLLACAQWPLVDSMFQDNSLSLLDTASLTSSLPLSGVVDSKFVTIKTDEDLRSFVRASAESDPKMLHVGSLGALSEKASEISVQEYVASREHAKQQQSVKLNVGGALREVHRVTAERIPLISAMMRFPRQSEVPIFVDASPAAFDVLFEVVRGRSTTYLDTLEPSLKRLVQEYAEYAGMSMLKPDAYCFRLTAMFPWGSTTNTCAFLSKDSTQYTTGVRPQWNTVVGDVQIPQTSSSYWEVNCSKLGAVDKSFIVGVVATGASNIHTCLDIGNVGWGLIFDNSGNVNLRTNGQSVAQIPRTTFLIDTDTKIGIMYDAMRGSLMFFLGGQFKTAHPTNLRNTVLYPAFSVYADTELSIVTGLVGPS